MGKLIHSSLLSTSPDQVQFTFSYNIFYQSKLITKHSHRLQLTILNNIKTHQLINQLPTHTTIVYITRRFNKHHHLHTTTSHYNIRASQTQIIFTNRIHPHLQLHTTIYN
uniref:SJCHGC02109 protein n=1 Tax=Schistosoma japonicum TaxID=6182 RepID=Q5DHA4_SCHJA|nr:SJCHGC02109 protein [Schistosoma japonicum]